MFTFQTQTVAITGDGESVLLNAGGQYGTMTIVPQENNGEVSYVLIVPANQTKQEQDSNQSVEEDEEVEEAEEEDQDLAVYDFNDDVGGQEQVVG